MMRLGSPFVLLSLGWVLGCAAPKADLTGSLWRLEDLGDAAVPDSTEATLEFMEEGKIGGRAPCNHYFGTVEVSGRAIRFSGLGSTKMACPDPIMTRETQFLGALEAAERFELEGERLLIYSKGSDQPLRFVRRSRA